MMQRVEGLYVVNCKNAVVILKDNEPVVIMHVNEISKVMGYNSTDKAFALLKRLGLEFIDFGFSETLKKNSDNDGFIDIITDLNGIIKNIPSEICVKFDSSELGLRQPSMKTA